MPLSSPRSRFHAVFRRVVAAAVPLAIAAAFSACEPPSEPTCSVSAVSLTPTTATVIPGASTQLAAVVTASNCNPTPATTWSSSAPNVATVSPAGTVTGVAAGSAIITATASTASATASITVAPPPVATLVITPTTGTTKVGQAVTLSVVTKDAQGNTLTGRSITWASLAPTVATVTQTGVVTGVSEGTATITASAEGKTGSAAVTVQGAPILGVTSVSPTSGSADLSIETVFRVTFSENVNASTVTAATVTLSQGGSPVAASRTVSGPVVTITPTSPLAENAPLALAITTGVKSTVGNTLSSSYAASFSVALFDPNYYYRFFNNLAGQSKSLDTYGDTFQGFMGDTGGYSGQFWYMSPINGAPGYYLMRNAFKGDNWYLEATDGVSQVELQNTAPTIFTGQMWRFAGNGFGPGCFSLQTKSWDTAKSMANVNGAVIMQPTASTGAQCWSIARAAKR